MLMIELITSYDNLTEAFLKTKKGKAWQKL